MVMSRYGRLLKVLIIADAVFAIGLLVLCFVADSRSGRDETAYTVDVEESLESLSAGGAQSRTFTKSDMFGDDIYDRKVIPSGEAMGIYMKTDGVLVVDICSFRNQSGESCCPVENLLQTGDYITSVDGTSVSKRSEILSRVADCGGESLTIGYVRDGKKMSCVVTPRLNESGNYLLGAWIKDDVSGIGTITFVDGDNFMALGHSVSDIDTGLTMRCSVGGVYTTDITGISKSYSSEPGKLQGTISYGKSLVGIIDGNSESGIYGHMNSAYCSAQYEGAEEMYIAHASEVSTGKAYIYSKMTGQLKKYEINIEIVDRGAKDKNIEFEVTDDELLALTGGVVQGMSGSPVIQNGKLIGAVTHVFVDDPSRGYGIFIEGMLK